MKAQTIAPAKELTSASDIPANNLYASLIVGRSPTLELVRFYCALLQYCDDECKIYQSRKCNASYNACLANVRRAGQVGGGIGGAIGTALGGAVGSVIGTGIGGVIGYQTGKKTAQTSKRAECLYKREECFADFQWYTNCVASCKAAGLDDTNAAPSMKSMGGG